MAANTPTHAHGTEAPHHDAHPGHHAGERGGHHGDNAPVAHHFNNLLQQQATVRFGMWLFLVTEVLFFGGAFCAYTLYRIWFPKEFEAGSAALNVGIASVNTFLLLTSSLTVTLAIRACYARNRSLLKFWLGVTIILGSVFLGLKMREYYLDYEEGLIPTPKTAFYEEPQPDGTINLVEKSVFGQNVKRVLEREGYAPEALQDVNTNRVQLFFIFYYCMTGLHVIHMVIGIGLLGWQFTLAHFNFFNYSQRYVYIEVMSLYWHFVDMVWMFLLPLLYLAGPHNLTQAIHQFGEAMGLASGH